MQSGIYRATFGTAGDMGGGLLTIREGLVNGGDQWFLYRGKLLFDGEHFTGHLRITQYEHGNTSVFGTIGNFELQVEGKVVGGGAVIEGHGRADVAPGRLFAFNAKKVGDLAE